MRYFAASARAAPPSAREAGAELWGPAATVDRILAGVSRLPLRAWRIVVRVWNKTSCGLIVVAARPKTGLDFVVPRG